MRRAIPVVLALGLLASSSSLALASRPSPTQQVIRIAAASVDVDASCLGQGSPCDGTVELTMRATSSSQPPFSAVKGIKGPQAIVATFDFPMANYDASTGCFSGVASTIQFFVPKGKGQQLAFTLDSVNGAGCGNGFTAAFTLDGAGSEVKAFAGSTGTGTLLLAGAFDLEATSVSALQLDLNGIMSLAS